MADENPTTDDKVQKSLKQKAVFYTTAFFILLAIFSLFGFLFLVPFTIEPAYSTIKMQFDEQPAECFTVATESKRGLSNCSWTSCREGCTREIYECTQILVNYRHPNIPSPPMLVLEDDDNVADSVVTGGSDYTTIQKHDEDIANNGIDSNQDSYYFDDVDQGVSSSATSDSYSKFRWFYRAKLFPNVKGCGYPPFLNCTVFNNTYVTIGSNYSCYFSRVDPSLVISELDMSRIYSHIILASLVPVLSFIISVIYLIFAYLYIYNDPNASEKTTPSRRKPIANNNKTLVQVTPLLVPSTPIAPPASSILSPVSDQIDNVHLSDPDVTDILCDRGTADLIINSSFGNRFKYEMVDQSLLSVDSFDSLAFNQLTSSCNSMNGNLNRIMRTCVLTPPGPIAKL